MERDVLSRHGLPRWGLAWLVEVRGRSSVTLRHQPHPRNLVQFLDHPGIHIVELGNRYPVVLIHPPGRLGDPQHRRVVTWVYQFS